ncbi:MAG: hypothetical protein F4160_17330 [Rhodospirillaceae bacterium]|nr:hypothetical protein [Rhodospirillaceae bacterium]
MEWPPIDVIVADLSVRFGWYAVAVAGSAVAAVIGTLLWGKGGRKRIVAENSRLSEDNKRLHERLTALEARASIPAITQVFNHGAGAGDREIRDAIDSASMRGLRETIRKLPQKPLGDGHTLARLPDGTNIVSMADGEYRLAMPVRLSASIPLYAAGGAAEPTVTKADDDR